MFQKKAVCNNYTCHRKRTLRCTFESLGKTSNSCFRMRIPRRSTRVLIALAVLLCINNGVFIGFFRAAKTFVCLARDRPESSSTANTDLAPDHRDVQARSASVTASSNGNVSGDANRTGVPRPSGGVSKGLDPAGGAGQPMEAWGRVVKPRANVTAPWSLDNTSTLCPLVPPNLGEIGTYF